MALGFGKLLLALLALGAGLLVFYPQIERFFVFFPDRDFDVTPSELGLNFEDVHFPTADGLRLHGWFFPLEDDGPVLLFCHGNAGNISHRLENIALLLQQGIQVFIFDYRGYGRSPGRPSEQGVYLDGLAACDWLLRKKGVPAERITVFGRSLGAAVAIEVALNRPLRSLVIESAFTSTREMARTMLLFWPLSFVLPAHFDSLGKIVRVTVPKLMLHGERDEIVPFEMGRRIYQAAREPKRFHPIEQAGHNDTYLAGGTKYFETLAGLSGTRLPESIQLMAAVFPDQELRDFSQDQGNQGITRRRAGYCTPHK